MWFTELSSLEIIINLLNPCRFSSSVFHSFFSLKLSHSYYSKVFTLFTRLKCNLIYKYNFLVVKLFRTVLFCDQTNFFPSGYVSFWLCFLLVFLDVWCYYIFYSILFFHFILNYIEKKKSIQEWYPNFLGVFKSNDELSAVKCFLKFYRKNRLQVMNSILTGDAMLVVYVVQMYSMELHRKVTDPEKG